MALGSKRSIPAQPQGKRAEHYDYTDILSGLPVGLYRSTPAGQILDVNLGMTRMLGYPSREALLTIKASDLYVHPEDRRQWQAVIERDRVLIDYGISPLGNGTGGDQAPRPQRLPGPEHPWLANMATRNSMK